MEFDLLLAISYIYSSIPFVFAAVIGILLFVLVFVSAKNFMPVMWLYGAIFIADNAAFVTPTFKLGLNIYFADIPAVIMAIALVYRVMILGYFKRIPNAWWYLGFAQLVVFLWGSLKYGTAAGVDYRQHFYFWVGSAYLASFGYSEDTIKRLFKLLYPVAIGLLGIAVYRWVEGAIDWQFQRYVDYYVTTGVAYRVIWVQPTFYIGLAMLLAIYSFATARLRIDQLVLAIGLGLIVLVLQHRSVWVASVMGVAMLILSINQREKGAGSKVLIAGLGLVIAVAVGVTSLKGASDSVVLQADRALSTTGGTFVGGRVESWKQLVSSWVTSGKPASYLVGQPYGGGYSRYTSGFGGHEIGYQPHNYFVHLLYRGGLIGLVSFLWVYIGGLKLFWAKVKASKQDSAPIVLAMAAAFFMYLIPYAVNYSQIFIMGLILAVVGTDQVEKIATKLHVANGLRV